MAVNRAVSSHVDRVGLTRASVPDSAIMRLDQWPSSARVAWYIRGEKANVVVQRDPGTSMATAVPLLYSPVCRFPLLLLHRSKGTLLVLDG